MEFPGLEPNIEPGPKLRIIFFKRLFELVNSVFSIWNYSKQETIRQHESNLLVAVEIGSTSHSADF